MRLTRFVSSQGNLNKVRNSFFVTTPIYYVNAAPHIGHLYSSLIADAAHRWRKLYQSEGIFKFSTGTDEHGSKIQKSAIAAKKTLPDHCSYLSSKYSNLCQEFDINYTDFIRTSEVRHKEAVQHFWNTISSNGHIYSANYSGWYSVPDESYISENDITEKLLPDGRKVLVSIESGHTVEWCEEENYMFKLTNFVTDLRHWILKDKTVRPEKFRKILLDMLEDDVRDISISRPICRVQWAVPVPNDETQSIYVWMDALVNYLTVTNYPNDKYKEYWPADVHVIGKDILKFHGIYWPAFLMAANIEPPKSIWCHSHWTVNDEKMSKSKKNVVCPFEKKLTYTEDGLRYFLLREGVPHNDGNYSETKITRILNSELADTLGNLLSRSCGKTLNPEQQFPAIQEFSLKDMMVLDATKNLISSLKALPGICEEHYEDNNFYKVVDATIATLHIANSFVESSKPWELRKQYTTLLKLNVVLHLVFETLRICGVILSPIVPKISKTLLDKMCIPESTRTWASIKNFSFENKNFKSISLSSDKAILFQKIITDSEINTTKREKKVKSQKC